MFLHFGVDDQSRKPLLFKRLRSADRTLETGRGPTWCAGETDEGSSPDHEGQAAANLPRGRAIYARDDYASCTGGGDDCADRIAH